MDTSISSEALSQLGVEKIAFTPKPDGHKYLKSSFTTKNYKDGLITSKSNIRWN